MNWEGKNQPTYEHMVSVTFVYCFFFSLKDLSFQNLFASMLYTTKAKRMFMALICPELDL